MRPVLLAFFALPAALAATDFSTLSAFEFVEELLTCDLVPCTISNQVYTGVNIASGIAALDDAHYISGVFGGDDAALVLSTGSLTTAERVENAEPSQTTGHLSPGDADLAALAGLHESQVLDASAIEFDVTYSRAGEVAFDYVFASEEYPAAGINVFNDLFAFFIDGQNVGVLDDGTKVSISSVNSGSNPEFFVDNDGGAFAVEYDGLTTKLRTKPFAVEANRTYRVKLVIADAADAQLDSAVYMKMGSWRIREPGCGNDEMDGSEECDGEACCNFDCTLDVLSDDCIILCLEGILDKTDSVCCAGSCSECSGCACVEGAECCPRLIAATEVPCLLSGDVECLVNPDYIPAVDFGVESC